MTEVTFIVEKTISFYEEGEIIDKITDAKEFTITLTVEEESVVVAAEEDL